MNDDIAHNPEEEQPQEIEEDAIADDLEGEDQPHEIEEHAIADNPKDEDEDAMWARLEAEEAAAAKKKAKV